MKRLFALALALGLGAMPGVPSGLAAPRPKPEAPPPPPPPSVINGAMLQGLDKITGRVTKFVVAFGQPVKFGTLVISVSDCRRSPPEADPEGAAFLDIKEILPGAVAAQPLFHGWMFESSPALNPLEHPVYDVWLLDCSTTSGSPPAKPG